MYTENNHLGDLLLIEVHPRWTRRKAVVVAASGAALGTVLGKVTATGKYQPLDLTADTGIENAAAVLITNLDADAGDQSAVVIERGAVVNVDALVWPDGISAGEKTAALAQLTALGVLSETVL